MMVDDQEELCQYVDHKKCRLRYSSYACDFCKISFEPSFLNLVTLKSGLFFGCSDCCEKILLIDGWKSMAYEKVLDVLSV